jgi:ABC-type Fe3+ transport system substrate-binding protein
MTKKNQHDSIFKITEQYPETIPVFVNNGFPQMNDRTQRESLGKNISLKIALSMKQLDGEMFKNLLQSAISSGPAEDNGRIPVKISGLLPCPVRLPILEEFEIFKTSYEAETENRIDAHLKAASMGLQWLEEEISEVEDPAALPDVFISAGFDFFFDKKKIGRFNDTGVFSDSTGITKYNNLFSGLSLEDPRGQYSLISAVPAVFLVNPDELHDSASPTSWADILNPEFENRVSIPTGDFDLFNAILLNIQKLYGDKGVRQLGKSLMESMHPSQMVKSGKKKGSRPTVSIVPYFFTRNIFASGGMEPVWPSDGAILSPIFLLSKKDEDGKLKLIVDFFSSPEIGSILAHKGLFPSTHPDVDNKIDPSNKFIWLGWDYIYSNDISSLIKDCETLFEGTEKEGVSA